MANEYFDSQLSKEQIESVLTAINGLISPSNNGKVIAINSSTGKLEARSVQWGGSSSPIIQPLSVTQNGIYTVPSGVDGYSPVTVNVSGGGTSGVYKGTAEPTPSLGSDGEYYIREMPIASGVNFVDYLETDGNSYFDTEIIPSGDSDIYAEVYKPTASSGFLLGCRSSSYGSLSFNIGPNEDTTNGFHFDYYTTRYNQSISPGTFITVNRSSRENKHTVNSKSWIADYNYTVGYSFVVFGMKNSSGITKALSGRRIRRCAIGLNGNWLIDYIAAIDANNVPCMWDNVNQEYVYNDGTGSFTAGNGITPDPLPPVCYQKINGVWTII